MCFLEQLISSQLSVGLIMAFQFSWKIDLQSQERNIFRKVKELVKEFQRINWQQRTWYFILVGNNDDRFLKSFWSVLFWFPWPNTGQFLCGEVLYGRDYFTVMSLVPLAF